MTKNLRVNCVSKYMIIHLQARTRFRCKNTLADVHAHAYHAVMAMISIWTVNAIRCDGRFPHNAAHLHASHSRFAASPLIDLQQEIHAEYSAGQSIGCVFVCGWVRQSSSFPVAFIFGCMDLCTCKHLCVCVSELHATL